MSDDCYYGDCNSDCARSCDCECHEISSEDNTGPGPIIPQFIQEKPKDDFKERLEAKKMIQIEILEETDLNTLFREQFFVVKNACKGLPNGIYLKYLYESGWNKESTENYLRNNSAKLKNEWHQYKPVSSEGEDEFECSCCIDDFPVDEAINIGCKHLMCRECASEHLKLNVWMKPSPDDMLIPCPCKKSSECNYVFGDDLIELLGDDSNGNYINQKKPEWSHTFQHWKKKCMNSMIKEIHNLEKCSNPKFNCKNVIYYRGMPEHLKDLDLDPLCLCGHSFCHNCK